MPIIDTTFSANAGRITRGDARGTKLPATTHWPEIEVVSQEAEKIVLQLAVNAELIWFNGHFTGQPVLPGVVQTHWAGLLALELFAHGSSLQFQQLLKLKFNSVVTPGQVLQLALTWQPGREQCQFRYLDSNAQPVSSGTIRFTSAQTS